MTTYDRDPQLVKLVDKQYRFAVLKAYRDKNRKRWIVTLANGYHFSNGERIASAPTKNKLQALVEHVEEVTKDDLNLMSKELLIEELKHMYGLYARTCYDLALQSAEVADWAHRYRALQDNFNAVYADLHTYKTENESLKKIIDTHTIPKHPGGRPSETARLQERATEVRRLLEEGMSQKQVCETMHISRATFFRYKKYL